MHVADKGSTSALVPTISKYPGWIQLWCCQMTLTWVTMTDIADSRLDQLWQINVYSITVGWKSLAVPWLMCWLQQVSVFSQRLFVSEKTDHSVAPLYDRERTGWFCGTNRMAATSLKKWSSSSPHFNTRISQSHFGSYHINILIWLI